ncbi:amidase [Roseococcus sp. YIM B11640]|uniref:amidase n=1 Tax=Roseococcus sp. YIM B11640 TaxID=3133973 RepID=UPI003C7AF980
MNEQDLLFTPATRAAAMIRQGRLSALKYVEAVLGAIAREQPRLNTFVEVLADDARREAKAADAAVRAGEKLGPLHGVPVHIKDLLDVKGVPTRKGSAIFADAPPAERDDVLVERLRAAGAIIIGKSTTPEFGNKGLTDSPPHGITRNPWNTARTSGGSSGGAAAAVAAGLGPLGLGTDGAGSVRGPAACCGVVGLKPTLGTVPYEATADAFGNNIFAGPLARTVTDAAVMHAVMTGGAPADPWSLKGEDRRALSPRLIGSDLSGVRIGFLRRCHNPRVAADVEANLEASLAAWAAMGAEVEEIVEEIDWIEYEGRVLYQGGFHASCGPFLPRWQNQMDPVTLAFMERGSHFTLADFRTAQFKRTALFRAIQGLLARYDFLVTPTASRTALPVEFDAANDEVEVDGVKCGITRQGWTAYQYPFNLTGHPALSLPSGFGADGLPTAVQIVGAWGAETDVLRLGALLEQARPWAQHRPPAG